MMFGFDQYSFYVAGAGLLWFSETAGQGGGAIGGGGIVPDPIAIEIIIGGRRRRRAR